MPSTSTGRGTVPASGSRSPGASRPSAGPAQSRRPRGADASAHEEGPQLLTDRRTGFGLPVHPPGTDHPKRHLVSHHVVDPGLDGLDDGLDPGGIALDRGRPRVGMPHERPVNPVARNNLLPTGEGEGGVRGGILAFAFPLPHRLVGPQEAPAGDVGGKGAERLCEEVAGLGAVDGPQAQMIDGVGTGEVTHHLDDRVVPALVIDPGQPVAAEQGPGSVPADAAGDVERRLPQPPHGGADFEEVAGAACVLAHRIVVSKAFRECCHDAGNALKRSARGADVGVGRQGPRVCGIQQCFGTAAPRVGKRSGPLQAGFESQGLRDDLCCPLPFAVPAIDRLAPPDDGGPVVRGQARIVIKLAQDVAQRRHVARIEGMDTAVPRLPHQGVCPPDEGPQAVAKERGIDPRRCGVDDILGARHVAGRQAGGLPRVGKHPSLGEECCGAAAPAGVAGFRRVAQPAGALPPVRKIREGVVRRQPGGHRGKALRESIQGCPEGTELRGALAFGNGLHRRVDLLRRRRGLDAPVRTVDVRGNAEPGPVRLGFSEAVEGGAETVPVPAPAPVVIEPAGEGAHGSVHRRPVRHCPGDRLEHAGPVGEIEGKLAGGLRTALDLRHPLEKCGASKRLEGGLDGCHRRLEVCLRTRHGIEVTGLQRVVGQHRPGGRQERGGLGAPGLSIGIVRSRTRASRLRQGSGLGDDGVRLPPFFPPAPAGLPPAVHQVARRLRHTSAPGEILQGLQQPGVVRRVKGVYAARFPLPVDGAAQCGERLACGRQLCRLEPVKRGFDGALGTLHVGLRQGSGGPFFRKRPAFLDQGTRPFDIVRGDRRSLGAFAKHVMGPRRPVVKACEGVVGGAPQRHRTGQGGEGFHRHAAGREVRGPFVIGEGADGRQVVANGFGLPPPRRRSGASPSGKSV